MPNDPLALDIGRAAGRGRLRCRPRRAHGDGTRPPLPDRIRRSQSSRRHDRDRRVPSRASRRRCAAKVRRAPTPPAISWRSPRPSIVSKPRSPPARRRRPTSPPRSSAFWTSPSCCTNARSKRRCATGSMPPFAKFPTANMRSESTAGGIREAAELVRALAGRVREMMALSIAMHGADQASRRKCCCDVRRRVFRAGDKRRRDFRGSRRGTCGIVADVYRCAKRACRGGAGAGIGTGTDGGAGKRAGRASAGSRDRAKRRCFVARRRGAADSDGNREPGQ